MGEGAEGTEEEEEREKRNGIEETRENEGIVQRRETMQYKTC